MKTEPRLTERVHHCLQNHIRKGSAALDATAGNGADTLFLANAVGPTGCVYAVDIQPQAIANAREKLAAAGMDSRVKWITGDHAHFAQLLPPDATATISAACYNLGYLPGSDHQIVTHTASTLSSLEQLMPFLEQGALVSILAYRGHPGGREEADAIVNWAQTHSPSFFGIEKIEQPEEKKRPAPWWILLKHT